MYTFPFTDESVIAELCNTDLVVYRQERPDTKNIKVGVVRLSDEGKVTGHPEWRRWIVTDGVLYIVDDRMKPLHRIDSLETVNGAVYPMGESLREAKSKFSKTILVKKELPAFKVCISSHIKYYEETLPRLLKSLKRVGIMDVLVVISDTNKTQRTLAPISDNPGVEVRQVNYDKHGYTALLETDESVPYWLLLHDTCEVTSDFLEGIDSIDVGLNPDFVLLEENVDMGFYSSKFIGNARSSIERLRPDKIRKQLWNVSKAWIPGPKGKVLRAKDVYGGGTERSVLLMDIGIKKYLQGKLDGAKP